jgi:hypothetical protein
VRAFEVCARFTTFAKLGIDFYRSFPGEGFKDVGDYDVLAYWPYLNHWLYIECKYNEPPYCLKDARRLRERIFGKGGDDRGQFTHIDARRAFLRTNAIRIRELLGWPAEDPHRTLSYTEVYVSREIYWWMRNPPFAVPTKFVRIDALDAWLQTNSTGNIT